MQLRGHEISEWSCRTFNEIRVVGARRNWTVANRIRFTGESILIYKASKNDEGRGLVLFSCERGTVRTRKWSSECFPQVGNDSFKPSFFGEIVLDRKYECEHTIFSPAIGYQSDNPLNPSTAYALCALDHSWFSDR